MRFTTGSLLHGSSRSFARKERGTVTIAFNGVSSRIVKMFADIKLAHLLVGITKALSFSMTARTRLAH